MVPSKTKPRRANRTFTSAKKEYDSVPSTSVPWAPAPAGSPPAARTPPRRASHRTARHPPTPCAGVARRAGHFARRLSFAFKSLISERYRHVCDRERCGDCDGGAVEGVHLVANLPRQRFVLNLPQAGSVDVPDAGLCDVSETRSLRSLEPEAEEERHRHYGPLGGGRAGGELHRGED